MSIRGMSYYEKHFFFSKRLVKLFFGLRPSQSANKQLLQFCLVTVYIFPMIAHQFYQLCTSDVTLNLAIKLVQNMISVLCFLITYSFMYFNFETTRSIFAHFKFDYVQMSDENELNIFEQYTMQSKMYTYFFAAILNFYFIATISPCIFNLFLYIFGKLDKVDLKLPFPINNVSSRRSLYFSLLIYQIIAIYMYITIAIVCYTSYLIFIQHACCQLCVLKVIIREPFLNNKYNQIAWLNKKEGEFDWIVNVIIRHRRVTKLVQNNSFREHTKKSESLMFVDYLNGFSQVNYLICTFAGMLIIMLDFLNIFQLAKMMGNTSELIESGSYIVCSLFAIYINFYFGQTLIDHSQAAFIELCQVPFYTLSLRTQKVLLFVIVRSRKQCVLSIGGIFVSSHEVFLELIQKAFSFAMVYCSIQ